jgi:hypothetical protein
MKLPSKDYDRLGELADAWKCTEEDIFHRHGQGTIKLGVLVQNAGLVGLDANGRVLGYYRVSGVLSIPRDCAVNWELGGTERAEVEAVYVDPDCPPVIQGQPRPEFHDLEPSNYPPNWAPGCSWITPEGNHGLIREFRLGIYFGASFRLEKGAVDRGRIVVHAGERARFERNKPSVLDTRAETTYLNIIGGLLDLMLGKTPAGKAQSVYDNQAAVINALLAHYEGKPGVARRTLEEKFAAAKRSLNGT